jgi:hypothetical protein
MKRGTEDKKKLGILAVVGVLALGAAFYMYSELSTPDVAPPVAATVVTVPTAVQTMSGVAKNVGTSATHLDPTLHMKPMLVTEALVYSGSGRNIFSVSSAPVEIPKAIASARPKGPIAPAFTGPVGPPPPPPIDLKFFGTATSADGVRRAFLLHGEDVFLASPGDIVQRRYQVGAISANSIVVKDMTNDNTQTLPLIVN